MKVRFWVNGDGFVTQVFVRQPGRSEPLITASVVLSVPIGSYSGFKQFER